MPDTPSINFAVILYCNFVCLSGQISWQTETLRRISFVTYGAVGRKNLTRGEKIPFQIISPVIYYLICHYPAPRILVVFWLFKVSSFTVLRIFFVSLRKVNGICFRNQTNNYGWTNILIHFPSFPLSTQSFISFSFASWYVKLVSTRIGTIEIKIDFIAVFIKKCYQQNPFYGLNLGPF